MGQENSKITPIECDASHIEKVSNTLPVDIWCTILGYVGNYGLNIQEYRTHTQVCKGFYSISKLSVTKLDVIEIVANNPYRRCTLLAHIISEKVLQQFVNLRVLRISFADVNIYELYEKITNEEYKHKYLSNKINDDKKLNELDSDLEAGVQVILEVTKPYYYPLDFNEVVEKNGRVIKGLWAMLRTVQKTDTPLLQSSKISRSVELYPLLNKLIIEDAVCFFSGLEELSIHTCFDTSLIFVGQLRKLKSLSICASTSKFSGTETCLKTHMMDPHPFLKHFESDINSFFSEDIDWNMFPNVTSVSLDMRMWGTHLECNPVMKGIVKNLRTIEKLVVLGLSREKDYYPFECLKSLEKLQALDISCVESVCERDLEDICNIPNLRELTISYSQLGENVGIEILVNDVLANLCRHGDNKMLYDYFINRYIEEKRPDINVIYV